MRSSFLKEEFTNGRTHEGHNAMTIARWPLASGANNNYCFDDSYVGKQPVDLDKNCVKYMQKKPWASMDKSTNHQDISEIFLKF